MTIGKKTHTRICESTIKSVVILRLQEMLSALIRSRVFLCLLVTYFFFIYSERILRIGSLFQISTHSLHLGNFVGTCANVFKGACTVLSSFRD